MTNITNLLGKAKYTKLVSLLFNARTNAHIAHLQTKSYAQHIALGDLYEGILGIADSFAESAQGTQGILNGYTLGALWSGDVVSNVESLHNEISGMKKEFTEGHLLQLIDDATELTATTLYKLKNLR